MRLNNKFDALWKAVRRITEQTTDFSLDIQSNWVVPEYERIAIELKSGKDITISEVEIQNGLLTYKGQHVVLYIRDHGFKYERAIHDENERNKYHVADCGAITNLKNAGRFERLIATTNTSEKFLITGTTSSYRNTQQESTVRLRVCKACLIKLNYNNYNKSLEKYSIYEYFDLEEFFKSYSSFFKQLPSAASKINNSSVYADNWKQISKARKTLTGYCCQNCGVDLSKHPGLLHTHHINGVKSDNNFKNLKVLCIECHKAQPSHTHLKISFDDLKTLIALRNEQRPNLLAQKAKANSKNTLNYGVQKLNGLNNSTRQQEQKTHQPSSTSILGDYNSSQSSQQYNYQKVSPQTANSVREEQKNVLSTQNQDHKDTANRDHVAASKLSAVISTQSQAHKDTETKDNEAASKLGAVISTQSQANKDTETKDHEAASKPDAVISTQNQDHKDTANRDHVAASKPSAVISTQNQDHKDTGTRAHVAASKPGAVLSTQNQDHKDTGTRDHVAASKPGAVISTQNQDHKDTGTRDHVAESKPSAVISTQKQDHKDTDTKDHAAASKQGSVVATKNQSHKDTKKSKSHGSVSKQGTVFSTGKHEHKHKDGHNQPKVYIAKRPTIFSQSQKGGPSPYSSFMPAPGTAFEKNEWDRSLNKAPYALHPILAPFRSHKWPAPEINYKVGNKTFDAAWPARKTAIDLRANEKYLYQGWTVYSSKDILRNT
ncbi:HNH endonuclease [Anaerobiospirillum succiniciproducens]|uniref:HNH endonuclease n=1 Tax=Anaerobiospirillum succiniciproducens TaxID=13335 RepID=UPI00248E69A1|nr:hypothetical protein [Anaerobiospirillum succiniciproducens]